MRLTLLLPLLLLGGCLVPESMVDHLLDADDDGERTTVVGGTDCDDHDPKVRAHGSEVCGNRVDDDCDGATDDRGQGEVGFFADQDGDGFGDPEAIVSACVLGEDMADEGGDCDDADQRVHPEAVEDCANGIDDDCDATIDETDGSTRWWPDYDGDGWGTDAAEPVVSCTVVPGWTNVSGDCDDHDALAYPTARDRPYDGLDSGCDGDLLEFDVDGDGSPVDPALADPPVTDPGYAPWDRTDCDDRDAARHPGATEAWYDGVDADCDGADDFDQDGDGHADDAYGGDDCNDQDPRRHPGHPDVCDDGRDEDCDPSNEYDCDGDGHLEADAGGDDCDDADPDVWALCSTCADRDRDGRWSGCDAYVVHTGPDCNDLDAQVWSSCATCRDADGDGRLSGCDAYLFVQEDCDDADPRAWAQCASCADHDHDGAWALCDTPDEDCDDALENAWSVCGGCVDADGDGVGVGDCEGTGPQDCDDTDPDVDVSCGLCVDLDGDGSRTGCDQHLRTPYDCDDADPDVGGHVFEVAGDGLDQDCNGRDLTVSERDGLFVAPDSEDARRCGTRAKPCGTIGYAAGLAREVGKVVFVAEGTYPAFETWVSVYGGFEAGTWAEVAALTTVEVADQSSISMHGAATELADLGVAAAPGRSGRLAVGTEGGVHRLVRLDIAMEGSGVCTLVDSQATELRVEDSSLSGCGGRVQNTGVRLQGDRSEKMLIQGSSIDLVSAPSPAANEAVTIGPSVDTTIVDSIFTVDSADDITGFRLMSVGSFYVTGCRITIGNDSQRSNVALGIWGDAKEVVLRSSVIAVRGGHARAVHVFSDADDTVSEVASSILRADGSAEAAAFVGSHIASLGIYSSTIIARGPLSYGVSSGGDIIALNSIFASDGVGIDAVATRYSLTRNIFDIPCVAPPLSQPDCGSNPARLSVCATTDCAIVDFILWQHDVLIPDSPWGASPSRGGPADASGASPYPNWPYDLQGIPIAGGAWNIGAAVPQ